MPRALQKTVQDLTTVLLQEVEKNDWSSIVRVLPAHRNASVKYYLATNESPRLRFVILQKCGKTWMYFQRITEKETYG